MKLFRLILSLALPASAWAVNRTLNVSGPTQVYAGQSFTVTTSASTDATDGEQINFYHGKYSTDGGATWNWFCADVNVGTSATRNAYITAGAAGTTVIVWAKPAFRFGAAGDVDYTGAPIDWGGSWDANAAPPAKYAYISVVAPPNQAPTITWTQAPASAWINQWFQVQARGNDGNGNLSNVWVWKEWVPFAFNGGGNGWEGYSDANWASRGTAGTVTFQAQSGDSAGATSAVITHTVSIPNRDPSVSVQILNSAQQVITLNGNGRAPVQSGGTFYIRVNGSDPDSRLGWLYSRLNDPAGNPVDYPIVPVSGASASQTFGPYTANQLGVWDVWAHAQDLDSGGYQWQGGGWWGTHAPDVEVQKIDQTITFAQPATQAYGTSLGLSASATSGLPVSFTVLSGPATLSGNTLTFTGTGTVTVRASQAGNANYNAAPNVDRSFTVAPASQSISFTQPANKTFGDAPFGLSASATSGLAVSFSIVTGPATISGSTVTITGVGTVTVRASQAGNANYYAAPNVDLSFTVSPRPVTFSLSQASFTYNGAAQGPSVVPSPSNATFTTGGTLSATVVGSYTATATATGNYTGSNSSLTWSIAASGQSINFPAIPTQTFGSTLNLTGWATATSGLTVTYGVTSGPATIAGNTVSFTGAGTVTVTAYQSGDANYGAATPVARSFTVNPQPTTFAFGSLSQTYNGALRTATVTPTPGGATYSADLSKGPGAGSYTVTATANGNYTGSGSATLVINKATPSATFAARTRTASGTGYTVQAADLDAVFSGPGGAAAPTGAVSFTIAPGSAAGTAGSAVGAGTSLGGGLVFTVRASYPGDSNYLPATIDAVWTINLDPNADNDGDGMLNGWEQTYGLNPLSAADAPLDPDNDGFTNVAEFNLSQSPLSYNAGTSALGNGIPGGWPNGAGGPNHSANLAVGATAGELNVDKSGATTYSIAIWTTPGTAGMEPKMSLNYSSQAGPGIAGFGWSIGGASAITRGPTSLAVDGYVDGVDFDTNDQFYLDGQRLILVAGTHGQPGAEYRTELETFTKVTAYGSRGNGPARFKAQTKAGLTIWFGNADSDSTNDGSTFDANGRSEPFSWHVSRIQDTAGNYMRFEYTEDSANGLHYLSRIYYTGNGGVSPYASLRFEYEDRPDWQRGWLAGSPVSSLKRLKWINACYGEQVARTYTLNYTNRTTANPRSLLTSLVETGADGKSYPPLTFEYEDPTGGWAENPTFQTPAALSHLDYQTQLGAGIMDLDADGFADFVRKKTSNSGVLYNDAWLNRPSGWIATPASGLPDWRIIGDAMGLAYEGRNDAGTRFTDINGDGLVDVIFSLKQTNGVVANYLAMNNGAGWSPNSTWTLASQSGYASDRVYLTRGDGQDYGRRLVDINGDGLVDVVWNFDNDPNEKGCLINNTDGRYQPGGAAWVRADQWAPQLPVSGNVSSGSQFMDVNGDGLPDQVQFGLLSNATEAGVALNSSSGWTSWLRVTRAHSDSITTIRSALGSLGKYLPPALLGKDGNGYAFTPVGSEIVDLNGDGLPDQIFSNPNLAANSYLNVTLKTPGAWLNTGDGWVASTEYAPPSGVYLRGRTGGGADSDPTGATLADLNGDGLADLAVHRSDQSSFRQYYLNTGRGWGAYNTSYLGSADLNLPHALAHGTATAPSGTQLADINGDGIADSVFSDNTQPYVNPQINQANPKADRLKKVTNGLGVAANITYAVLTERDASGNPTIYTRGTGGPAYSTNIAGPMLVTKAVSHDDGVGGQYALNYKYAGLRAHRFRGSLGFEKLTVTDSRTSIRTETTYAQTYPFTGMPISSQTISGTTVLKDSLVVYQEKLLNGGLTRFVFAQDSDETTRDLNGATLGSTSTTIPTPATDIDDYGNIKKLVVDTDGYTKTTDSVFTNDAANWFLGRLTSSTVTTTASGQTTQVRTSSFTYDPTTGLLLTENVQPGDAVLGLTTTYGYDQFGNKTSVAVSGYNLNVDANGNYSAVGSVSRTTTTQYDGNGRFPLWTRNALNHQENYTGYDQVKGVLTSMTGANGLATSWAYDGFGRKIQETRADGTVTNTNYRWVSGAPGQAKYYTTAPTALYHVETESTGAPPSLAFHDAFGRAFLTLGVNGDGNIVYTTTHHDNMGRAYAASVPYLASGSAWWTRTTSFDLLNRPVTVVTPDDENGDQTTSYSYNGLTVEVTDPKGRVARTVKNSQGWTIENTRNATGAGGASASTVTYGYDVLGNLTYTNAAGVATGLAYDGRGRKTSMTDADMGTWQYRYNVFGELIWQKDAKGQIVTMAYDALGRLTSRTEGEGTTTWTYDTSPTRGIGKLHTVTAPAGLASAAYSATHLYDTLGRPIQVTQSIDGLTYTTQTAYDGAGRVLRTIYPAYTGSTSISTRHVYNAFGYLQEIRNWLDSDTAPGAVNRTIASPTGRLYWRADSYAVTGKINGETYGNGLAGDRVYSSVTGRLVRATIDRGSVITAPFFVQDLNYTYDAMGNVKSRIDYTTGFNREERFSQANGADGYDGLDRLRIHRVVGGATVTVDYDAKGNITNKSDVGLYSYTGYGPHAVSTAGVNTYTYDGVGNMLTGAGRTLEWTSFNQLRKVTQGNKSSEFAFGAGHERVLQIRRTNGTVTDRTTYVGSLYERVHTTGGLIEHKHYIMGPTGRIAVHTERSDLTRDTRWFHTDGLGSITVISDEAGRVLKRHTYDAWGKQATSYTNTGSGITNTAPSTRGFTDHEMLSDFGLIHMNGRVYDPVLGRFLSADPNVDGVEDAQGYNRYSYVQNNPMNATDPSGYFSLKEVLGAIVAIVVTAIAIVVLGPSSLAAQGFFTALKAGLTASYAIGAAAIGGFAGSFTGSLLNGGNLGDAFKAGLVGAAVGAATAFAAGQIGGFFDDLGGNAVANWGGRTLAHATVGGLASEAQGGSFRHGFYSSAASAGIMHIKSVQKFFGDGRGGPWIAARTTAAAVIGGTASVLSGGKFANGAVTSAFQQLFNAESTNKLSGRKGNHLVIEFDSLGEGQPNGTIQAADWAAALAILEAAPTDYYDSVTLAGHGIDGSFMLTETSPSNTDISAFDFAIYEKSGKWAQDASSLSALKEVGRVLKPTGEAIFMSCFTGRGSSGAAFAAGAKNIIGNNVRTFDKFVYWENGSIYSTPIRSWLITTLASRREYEYK